MQRRMTAYTKTHIMMINSQLFIYSFIKCRDMLHSKISVLFIIGKFIGNPKNSCPNSLNDVSGKQITVTAFYEETSLSVFNSKNLPCFFISSSYVPDSTHSPSSITTILFASRIVESLCATMNVVLPFIRLDIAC